MRKPIAALVLICSLGVFALPASAASPRGGSITKSKRSVSWSGGPYTVGEPAPDPVGGSLGLGIFLYNPDCHTDSMCDHFALKVTLGDKAKFVVKIKTPNPNPSSGLAQPVTGDDYDLYVYDPDGNLVSGDQGTTPAGNEKATIVHKKRFNGRAYDIAVRPWAVMPGSTYKGTVDVLTVGK